MCSLSARSSIGMSMSTYSRSHETGTLISIRLPLCRAVHYRTRRVLSPLGALARSELASPPDTPRRRALRGRGPSTLRRARSPLAAPPAPSRRAASADTACRCSGGARRTSKLLQEAKIVLVEEADVRRARAEHRQALDAAAPREPLVTRRGVADATQDVGVDHAAARGLAPALAAAGIALGIAALADH